MVEKSDVAAVLSSSAPTLQADGGDVQLVDVDARRRSIPLSFRALARASPMSQMTALLMAMNRSFEASRSWPSSPQ